MTYLNENIVLAVSIILMTIFISLKIFSKLKVVTYVILAVGLSSVFYYVKLLFDNKKIQDQEYIDKIKKEI